MKKTLLTAAVLAAVSLNSCMTQETEKFDYNVDRFADIQVLRYQVPGFEQLTLNQKIYVYYLTEAAIYGRDILFDQHGKYNLQIRKLLENIYQNYSGDKNSADYAAMVKYMKQVWFANGIHHHYSTDKFVPEFSQEFFAEYNVLFMYTYSNEYPSFCNKSSTSEALNTLPIETTFSFTTRPGMLMIP